MYVCMYVCMYERACLMIRAVDFNLRCSDIALTRLVVQSGTPIKLPHANNNAPVHLPPMVCA